MPDNVHITIGADETVTAVFEDINDSAQRSERVISGAMGDTEDAFDSAARSASDFGARLDAAAGFSGAMAEGMDGLGQASQSVSDLMSHSARKAEDLARAQNDVEQAAQDAAQAVEDLNQANRDAAQATIDAEQAHIDQAQALIDQATAEKDLAEARKKGDAAGIAQAENDIKQARLDGKQATEDLNQANRDGVQAGLDAKQAMIDQKAATNDLTTAQRELESQSSILTKITDWTGMLSGVLGGLVGIIGLVTAAQWAWNIAMAANPVGLAIAAIAALIAIIVLIATKTQWFQNLWKAIWGKIGGPVTNAWNSVKNTTVKTIAIIITAIQRIPSMTKKAFSSLSKILTSPFRSAFNAIRSFWNSTIGGFSFSIPGWVPGIGGASFSIPHMAAGGDVLRSGLAMIHAGERILPRAAAQAQRLPSGRSADMATRRGMEEVKVQLVLSFESVLTDSRIMRVIIEGIRAHVKSQGGGNVQVALGRGNS